MEPEEAGKLMEEGRCVHCKKRSFHTFLTCSLCKEYQYCSIECLESDRKEHKTVCDVIGIKKGLRVCFDSDITRTIEELRSRSRLLDDDGVEVSRQVTKTLDQSGNADEEENTRMHHHAAAREGRNRRGNPTSLVNDVKLGHGRFGGRIRVNESFQRGKKFGDGWWSPRVSPEKSKRAEGSHFQVSQTPPSAFQKSQSASAFAGSRDGKPDVRPKTSVGARGDQQRLKKESTTKGDKTSKYNYRSSKDEKDSNSDEDSKGHGEPDKTLRISQSHKERSSDKTRSDQLEEVEKGQGNEIVSSDSEKASKAKEQASSQKTKDKKSDVCACCKKSSGSLLTCSRCGEVKYCNKTCQKLHFKDHKEGCKRAKSFRDALHKLSLSGFLRRMDIYSLNKTFAYNQSNMFLELVGDVPIPLLLEVVGPYFHPFRHGAVVQDGDGVKSFVLFYTSTNIYFHMGVTLFANFPIPVPLSKCLAPGNFILLLEPFPHHFLDGTVGFRIDDMDSVHFLFMN
ncbi:uncharacterized protein LOC101859002 [Aplysia californica]|uniref:Uncharacterized protein LOC101859002 n=1 Tax=Aplysia californica TaxID=6500 RepID=A0ABM0JJY6_APLCA|nr:uncharacterized protein LOC101859002 [Aplysia californica]